MSISICLNCVLGIWLEYQPVWRSDDWTFLASSSFPPATRHNCCILLKRGTCLSRHFPNVLYWPKDKLIKHSLGAKNVSLMAYLGLACIVLREALPKQQENESCPQLVFWSKCYCADSQLWKCYANKWRDYAKLEIVCISDIAQHKGLATNTHTSIMNIKLLCGFLNVPYPCYATCSTFKQDPFTAERKSVHPDITGHDSHTGAYYEVRCKMRVCLGPPGEKGPPIASNRRNTHAWNKPENFSHLSSTFCPKCSVLTADISETHSREKRALILRRIYYVCTFSDLRLKWYKI